MIILHVVLSFIKDKDKLRFMRPRKVQLEVMFHCDTNSPFTFIPIYSPFYSPYAHVYIHKVTMMIRYGRPSKSCGSLQVTRVRATGTGTVGPDGPADSGCPHAN